MNMEKKDCIYTPYYPFDADGNIVLDDAVINNRAVIRKVAQWASDNLNVQIPHSGLWIISEEALQNQFPDLQFLTCDMNSFIHIYPAGADMSEQQGMIGVIDNCWDGIEGEPSQIEQIFHVVNMTDWAYHQPGATRFVYEGCLFEFMEFEDHGYKLKAFMVDVDGEVLCIRTLDVPELYGKVTIC